MEFTSKYKGYHAFFTLPNPGLSRLLLMLFFDYYTLDRRWAYPLRALNVFEVIYWFLLVAGIHHFARKEKSVVWLIVACSYILLFFLWLGFYVTVYK